MKTIPYKWTSMELMTIIICLTSAVVASGQIWSGGYADKPSNQPYPPQNVKPTVIVEQSQWIAAPPGMVPQAVVVSQSLPYPGSFEPLFAAFPNGAYPAYPGAPIRSTTFGYRCYGATVYRVICPDGRQPQMVVRWRRQAYRCDSYLYAYCGALQQVKDGVVIYEEDCYQRCFVEEERPLVQFYKSFAVMRPMARDK